MRMHNDFGSSPPGGDALSKSVIFFLARNPAPVNIHVVKIGYIL